MSSVYTQKKFAHVLGKRMAYVEHGSGDPVVFLHGNPTSSYLWRDVLPHLEGLGRLIAPDLIGMGDSDKLDESGPSSYGFVEHREYLWELLEQLQVRRNVVLVVHDWGSALGFDWASRHRDRVVGIAHMESLVTPMEWDDFGEAAEFFRAFRSPAGDRIVLEDNGFVEKMLPGATLTQLSAETMDVYRAPFRNPGEDRRPTLSWPREIPIAGEPVEVTKIFTDYGAWLAESSVPKLFINADPGGTVTGRIRDLVRTWPNQTEITVPGIHYVPEDSAQLVGPALARFVSSTRAHASGG